MTEARWIAVVAAFAVLMSLPILISGTGLPTATDPDAITQLSFAYSLHDAVWTHGEWPLWNPYFGGGVRWAGYLYNPGMSPIGAVFLVAGPVIGMKLVIVAAMILGGVGMYEVARRFLDMERTGALGAAALYLASTWMPGRLESGNYDEVALFAWPIALVCLDSLRRGRWSGLWLPICTVTAFAQAKYGAVLVVGAGLPFLLFAGARSRRARAWDVLLWAAGAAVGALLSLPKLLPLLPLLAMDRVDQTTYRAGHAYASGADILSALAATGTLRAPAHESMAVGSLGLALAAAGAILGWRRMLAVGALGGGALLFSLGPDAPIPLARLFASLPILSTMNSFAKYFNVFVLSAVCWLAGEGLAQLVTRLRERSADPAVRARVIPLAAAVATLAVALPALPSLELYSNLFEATAPRPIERGRFHQVAWGPFMGSLDRYRHLPPSISEVNQYFNLQRNVGTVTWYGNHVFPENAQPKYVYDEERRRRANPSYRGMVHPVAGETSARVGDSDLSYNRIRFDYACDEPCRIAANFNHDSQWTASVGQVIDAAGLLAVELPAARAGRVELRFRDPHFAAGCLAAGLGTAAGIAGLVALRRANPHPMEANGGQDAGPAHRPLQPREQEA